MVADPLVCGSHSNIPLCCQMFYDSMWTKLRKKTLPKGEQTYEGYIEKNGEYVHSFGFEGDWLHGRGYILCPECVVRVLEGRFKPHIIKPCDCALK